MAGAASSSFHDNVWRVGGLNGPRLVPRLEAKLTEDDVTCDKGVREDYGEDGGLMTASRCGPGLQLSAAGVPLTSIPSTVSIVGLSVPQFF